MGSGTDNSFGSGHLRCTQQVSIFATSFAKFCTEQPPLRVLPKGEWHGVSRQSNHTGLRIVFAIRRRSVEERPVLPRYGYARAVLASVDAAYRASKAGSDELPGCSCANRYGSCGRYPGWVEYRLCQWQAV